MTSNGRLSLSVLTCQSCLHWHDAGPQLLPSGQANASLPNQGECRHHLNAERLVRNTPQGPQVYGWLTGYPVVPADFPACGQHQLRVQLPA